MIKICATENSW